METIDRLTAVQVFAAVVESETFTEAARVLGVSKSHVSKQVAALEEHLGIRLLHRTTRRMNLTDEGQAYYERCRAALDEILAAEQVAREGLDEAIGTLRVSAPMSFGQRYLGPLMADFAAQYHRVEVDLTLTDRRVDLLEENVDLAIRIGQLSDSSMVARKLAPSRPVVVGSSEYFARRPRPEHPDDLVDHDCLIYAYQTTGRSWGFERDGERTLARVDGRVMANNGDVLRDAATRGSGLAYLPDFLVADDLRAGRLESVLDDWCAQRYHVWALYPHGRLLSAKVRLLVDFLATAFEVPPWV